MLELFCQGGVGYRAHAYKIGHKMILCYAYLDHLLAQTFLLPSPSAFSKFVLSVLKFLGILKFLSCTQNILGVLK